MQKLLTNGEQRRSWSVVEIVVDARQEEIAAWLMMQLGANGCELLDSGGNSSTVRATFENHVLPGGDLTAVMAALDEYGLGAACSGLQVQTLLESDWLAEWKKGFVPFAVGDRITICPVWLADSLDRQLKMGREVVLIDPGLAFGTGFHATTRFCLQQLQTYIGGAHKVLDVGTGSGILSVAAAKLNACVPIIAVETDPQAVRVARENFHLNGVTGRIALLEGSTDKLLENHARSFDLILSNLTYEDNQALMSDYSVLAKPGCVIIYAGVLTEKRDLMLAALEKNHLQLVHEEVGEMWTGVVAAI